MSFSFEAKNELCRLPVQKLCCARAEAYGILLYCNTFSASEVRIITGNPALAARLPKLFHRAFGLRFDRLPEEGESGKLVFQITDGGKLRRIVDLLGFSPEQNLALHINFGLLEEECCRASFRAGGVLRRGQRHGPGKALSPGAGHLPHPGQPGGFGPADGDGLSAPQRPPQRQQRHLFQAVRAHRGPADHHRRPGGGHGHHDRQGGQGNPQRRQPGHELRHGQRQQNPWTPPWSRSPGSGGWRAAGGWPKCRRSCVRRPGCGWKTPNVIAAISGAQRPAGEQILHESSYAQTDGGSEGIP